MHHDINLFMHHIDYANLHSALGFCFLLFLFFLLCLCPYPNTMPRKTRAHRTSSSSSAPSSVGTLFRSEKSQELFETLNLKRKNWVECKVLLNELDLAIRANFEGRDWLQLLDIDYPSLVTLIREFYSNLSIHVYDSNTLIKSWIRDVKFTFSWSQTLFILMMSLLP